MYKYPMPTIAFYALIALASVVLSIAVFHLNAPWVFPLDDAYIVTDNAQTLLAGGVDDSYQQSSLVGTTSAAHLLVVAAFGLVFSLELAAFLTTALFTSLYTVGLARLLYQISNSQWVTLAAVTLGLFTSYSLRQLYGGLETGLAMAAVVWGLSLTASNSRTLLPILCGIMPFIRPELAALGMSIFGWRWYKSQFNLSLILRDISLFALAFFPWLAWFYFTTGHISSHTGSAKVAFFAEAALPWSQRWVIFSAVIRGSTLLALLVGVFFLRNPYRFPALVFTIALLGAYLLFLPGGLGHNSSRYLHILLPIGLAGYVTVISALSGKARVAFLVLFSAVILVSPAPSDRFALGKPLVPKDGRTASLWAKSNLPANARVLIHDAGMFAWETSFETTDIVGLKTPSSIASHEKFTRPSAGQNRSAAINEIAVTNDITHAIILNDLFWGQLANDLREEGWELNAIREPKGPGYVIYEISKPELDA